MYGFDFYKFKLALKKLEEENYLKLQADVKKVKIFVENALAKILETTAKQGRTKYMGLEKNKFTDKK